MKRLLSAFFAALFIVMNAVPAHAREAPQVISETAVLIDAATGQVLYEKEKDKRMYPASTTKVLTGLLAVENGDMADSITFSHDAVYSIGRDTSHASISEGEVLTLEQAMYAMAIESANDAANGIGEYLTAKTGKSFSQLANERARRAGAKNSNFVNPHGLHDENHYTTAYDLALIAAQRVKNDTFNRIFSAETYSISPTNKQPETRTFHSANWFLNGAFNYDGIVMSKTGWTQEAAHTMVTCAERNGVKLICVVMYSRTKSAKWDDTRALFDWAFENFKPVAVSGEYIALSAPDRINCDGSGRLYIAKKDIQADTATVLLSSGDSAESVQVEFSAPSMSEDMQTAEMTATLYTGKSTDKNVLATVQVNAPVSELLTVTQVADARSNPADNMLTTLIFGLLTFVAVMICDILIGKRI